MSPHRPTFALAVACAALGTLAACSPEDPVTPAVDPGTTDATPSAQDAPPPSDDSGVPEPPPAEDPLVELGGLLRQIATDQASVTEDQVALAVALLQGYVMPEVQDAEWQLVPVLGAPTSDFHADLMSKDGRKLIDFELRHRGEVTDAERRTFGDQSFQGFECSRRGRFLFVLVGNVELRLTGEDPAFRSPDTLEPVLASFPLEQIAEF